MFSFFCYRRTTTSSCTFEYFVMKNKKDQHKQSLVKKAQRKNDEASLWLTIVQIICKKNSVCFHGEKRLEELFFRSSLSHIVVQESKDRSIYIAKYIMNCTSSWSNIIWIVIFFPIYLSVKWRFCRQFTEKTYNCSEAKHMKKLEKNR